MIWAYVDGIILINNMRAIEGDTGLLWNACKELPSEHSLLSMEPWGLRPIKFETNVAVPLPAPVRVPSQKPLAPSVKSVANDMGDNEMILGAVHRSPGICHTAEENLS